MRSISCLAVALVLSGCVTSRMMVSEQQIIATPSQSKSQVVFMRSTFVGSAISASLYEVTGGEIKFIGIMNNGTKIVYETSPGKHTFMVVSEAADFMEANLSEGKSYYSIATPRMGAWVTRFSLWPIKADENAAYNTASPNFDKWLSSTKLVVNSDDTRAWYEKNSENVHKKYTKYWAAWVKKSEVELAKRTLNQSDGV